jgi:ribosomal protein S18 acetylase RimI-like enzyme
MKSLYVKLYSVLFALSLFPNIFGIEIARAQESDRDGIRAILEQDIEKHFIIDGQVDPDEVKDALDETLFTTLGKDGYRTIVAHKDGKVAGFITYKYQTTYLTQFYEWFTKRKIRMVQHMGVNSVFKRQGIGTELMTNLIEQLRIEGVNYIVLCAISKNIAARNFYESLGFYISYPGEYRISSERIEELKDEPQQYYELAL